ncbi:MAG: DUF2619 domain-containing protein [Firmicutes bacterium]|nr:DUF2619 domain-containing protein [Bacillota bacterium]
MESRLVLAMALLRIFAGSLEVTAALLMLYLGRVESAFRINAWLGVIGPTIFLIVSSLGLAGMVGQVTALKIALLLGAVLLLLTAAQV